MSGNKPQAFARETLQRVLALWKGELDSLELLGESNHLLYGFRSDGKALVLRLSKRSYRQKSLLRAELDWITHLAANGVSVCPPEASVNGRWIEPVWPRGGERCFASVFRRAQGLHVNSEDCSVWNATLFEKWGRTMGRMHFLSRSFRARWFVRRPVLDGRALAKMARRILPPSEERIAARLERSWAAIKGLPRGEGGYGLIHGDLTPRNFVLEDGGLAVFDFDDSSYCWFIYDITVVLFVNLLPYGGRKRGSTEAWLAQFLPPFLSGYLCENPLDREWFAYLPEFLVFFNLLFLLSFFQKGEAPRDERLYQNALANLSGERTWAQLDFRRFYDAARA